MIRQVLIEEMFENKNKARHFCGKPPKGAEYAASEYLGASERAYYKDRNGNWYFKVIDRSGEY